MTDPAADLSRGPVLLSLSLATASFAFATTFVRFYTRKGIDGGFGADDYTSGAATVIALIGTIFGILESTASGPTRALQFNVFGQPWYLVSVTLSKISICLFFMGLLRRARPWRILLAGLIVVMAIAALAFGPAGYLQCRPLERVWDPNVAGDCSGPGTQMGLGYAQGAFSVFSWVFFALFPLLVVRDISRGGEPRWPFYVTSALSLVCGISAIVRTAQISQTAGVTTYTIHFFYVSLMANLEQNFSLIASNLLTFGPLFSPSSSPTTATTTIRSRSTSTTTSSASLKSKHSNHGPYKPASSVGTNRSRRSGKSMSTRRTATTTISSSPPSRADSGNTSTRSIVRSDSSHSHSRDHHHSKSRVDNDLVDKGEQPGEEHALSSTKRRRSQDGDERRPRDMTQDDDQEVGYAYAYGSDDDAHHRGKGSEDTDLEAWWPRGIIKTVEIEVVEEVNEEYIAAVAAAANARQRAGSSSTIPMTGRVMVRPAAAGVARQPNSNPRRAVGRDTANDAMGRGSGASGVEQDWEALLRAGPPR